MNRRGLVISAVLVVMAGGCYDTDRYVPAGPDSPDGTLASPILELTADPSAIRASGGAHATITARIDPRSSVKTLKFSTTRGTVSGNGRTTSAAEPTIDVPASDSGTATVDLLSSAQAGLATVTASITLPEGATSRTFTRTVDVMFTAVASSEVITLAVSPTSADADGASQVSLIATLLPEVAAANTTVTFTASAGDFATNKDSSSLSPQAQAPISGGVATAQLVAPQQPSTVLVSALVGTFKATTQVSFRRAAPDTIFVQPARSTVMRVGETVEITVYLVRDVGQTATNTVVTYEARDSAGATRGTFLAPTLAVVDPTDDSTFKRLKSTATFDPDDAMPVGATTITVSSAGKSASTVVQVN